MDNISAEELKEQSAIVKDATSMLTLKKERVEGYSLYDRVQQLQDDIVRLEEMQSNAEIKELAQLVDHVDYWKDTTGLSVVTVFKE